MRPADGTVTRELDGELVLLHVPSGEYFALNEVGLTVWQAIDDHGTIDAAIDAVTARFDVGFDVARVDVEALIGDLTDSGLIVTDD